jgi:hypothetical protein
VAGAFSTLDFARLLFFLDKVVLLSFPVSAFVHGLRRLALDAKTGGSGEAAQSAALSRWLLILAVLLHGIVSIQRGGRVLDVKRVRLPIVRRFPCDLLPFCLF